jgi:SEC-C motif
MRRYARYVPPPPHLVDPIDLLAVAPEGDYALLEFAAEWDDLVGVEEQLAAALRLFVITRDPLDWLPHRGLAWATSNGDGDHLELPVYVTLSQVQRRLSATSRDLAAAIGPLCETAVLGAIRCQGVLLAGGYPELAFRQDVPPLLSGSHQRRLGTPAITVQQTAWEPIGLGAIQDLVQNAFGPVELDRSTVALLPSGAPSAGCPACGGIRFGFPGELAEAQPAMCKSHREAADSLTTSRIGRARASNPAGWRAIGKAAARTNGLPEPVAVPAPERRRADVGRNDPCPCGSGRKYKHCCGSGDETDGGRR